MDTTSLEKNMTDKEINDKILCAIRLYEIHKSIQLLETMLDCLKIETNFKKQIIKSTLDTVGV